MPVVTCRGTSDDDINGDPDETDGIPDDEIPDPDPTFNNKLL